MSHVVQIQTQVRDAVAVEAACHRLGLPEPVHQSVRLYSGEASGLVVQLPGWQYAMVCDLATGQLKFDNFGGAWGEQSRLDQFLQAYAVEKAKLEARKRSHSVSEQSQTDGSIMLTIQVSGGAA